MRFKISAQAVQKGGLVAGVREAGDSGAAAAAFAFQPFAEPTDRVLNPDHFADQPARRQADDHHHRPGR